METAAGNSARRIALKVHYDGTFFNGFQIQDDCRTVQEELEKAINILAREDVRITASGRTDAGVHALGQVVHFDIINNIALDKMAISLNGILPDDISVANVFHVHDDFHARYGAVERQYQYIIYNSPLRSPFMKYRSMWVKNSINIHYLEKILDYLTGEKDFASFCKKKSCRDNTIRELKEITVKKTDDSIYITITGNAFLHHMIRIIIGTVIEIMNDGKEPASVLDILDKKDRDAAGPTVPPYGLYLKQVVYNPPLTDYKSAF